MVALLRGAAPEWATRPYGYGSGYGYGYGYGYGDGDGYGYGYGDDIVTKAPSTAPRLRQGVL